MRLVLGRGLQLGGYALLKAGRVMSATETTRQLQRWYQDQGETRHRLGYDLGPDAVVLDAGGYRGQWASDIAAMYGCSIHVFEPVPEFAAQIRTRFRRNPRISVHEYGLGSRDETVAMTSDEERSSAYISSQAKIDVQVRRIDSVLEEQAIEHVDLMKVNIEGGEFDLLPHMIRQGLTNRIDNLQVQFHQFMPNAAKRRADIRTALETTHHLTYDYPFIWENWAIGPENRP